MVITWPSYGTAWTYLALILGGGLTHQGGVVDETVLWCVFARLQGSKQSLLCSQDLHCGGWVLCQIQKGTFKQQKQISKYDALTSTRPLGLY